MLTEICVQSTPQFLGVPQSNQPKFRIGDYVRHNFDLDEFTKVEQDSQSIVVIK